MATRRVILGTAIVLLLLGGAAALMLSGGQLPGISILSPPEPDDAPAQQAAQAEPEAQPEDSLPFDLYRNTNPAAPPASRRLPPGTLPEPPDPLAQKPAPEASDVDSPHPNSPEAAESWVGPGFSDHTDSGYKKSPLYWLKDAQDKSGAWALPENEDDPSYTVFISALAQLAYVCSGYDHKEGDYRSTVRQVVLSTRKRQDNSGAFARAGDPQRVMQHAAMTMAMCELYSLSMDPVLKPICDYAVKWLLRAQSPLGGWAQVHSQTEGASWQQLEPDALSSTWALLALKSAKAAELRVADEAFRMAGSWAWGLRRADHTAHSARTLDEPAYDWRRVSDALFVLATVWGGVCATHDPFVIAAMQRLAVLPAWNEATNDYQAWYFSAKALFVGGEGTAWFKQMQDLIPDHKPDQPTLQPSDHWARLLGSVYDVSMRTVAWWECFRVEMAAASKD